MIRMNKRFVISALLLALEGCASESEVVRKETAFTLHSHLTPKVLALCIDGNAGKTNLFGTVQSRIINTGENALEVIVGSGETAHVVVRIAPENSGAMAEFHFGRTASWLTETAYGNLSAGCE